MHDSQGRKVIVGKFRPITGDPEDRVRVLAGVRRLDSWSAPGTVDKGQYLVSPSAAVTWNELPEDAVRVRPFPVAYMAPAFTPERRPDLWESDTDMGYSYE